MAVRLRPRNPTEALDLGFALVREHAASVYGTWLAAYLPVAFLVYALLWDHPFIAWCVLWWLKPLFDRILLALLSRSLFGEPTGPRATLGSPRQWLFGTRIFAALTWGRFDLARSFHLPVHQLERTRGKPGRQRIRLLDRDARGAASWLTFLLLGVEMFLVIAVSLALALLVPVQVPIESLYDTIFRSGLASDGALLGAVLGTLATSLVEPVYVAGGFTLYLQRRTLLEGWDIELRFRHLAERLAAPAASATGVAAALLLACVLLPMPSVSHAQAEAPAAREKDPAKEIKAVLAQPVFGRTEMRKQLEYVGPTFESKDESKPTKWDWSWIESIARFLSNLARYGTWIVGALALAIVLYLLARYARLRGFGAGQAERPDFLFGLDVRPESLPEDVAAAAAALAKEGRTREALSLLYRGALVRFLDQGMEFLRGDTEGDCLRKVETNARDTARQYFRRLVSAWQSLAYGHRAVGAEAVVALAGEWRREFAADAQAPR